MSLDSTVLTSPFLGAAARRVPLDLRVAAEARGGVNIVTSPQISADPSMLTSPCHLAAVSESTVLTSRCFSQLQGAYPWARESLAKHASDPREYVYSKEQLEKGQTYDELWNASQHEMVHHGKMHGFMR